MTLKYLMVMSSKFMDSMKKLLPLIDGAPSRFPRASTPIRNGARRQCK